MKRGKPSIRPKARRSKSPSPKRVKEIQKVFVKLGIGDDESRRNARPVFAPASEQMIHYRIILSGSTLL